MNSLFGLASRPRIPKWLLMLGLCAAAVAYFWAQSDHITATVLAALTVAGFGGYRVGAAKLLGFFGGMALAVTLAPVFGSQLEPCFSEWFGTTGFGNRALSIGATGLGILLAAVLTTQLFTLWMLHDRPLLQAFNRWLGFSVGVLQGSAVMLLLVGGLLVVEPAAKNQLYTAARTDSKLSEIVTRRVIKYAKAVHESSLGPWVAEYNPFRRVPQLAQLVGSVGQLSSPPSPQRVTTGSDMSGLGLDPSMVEALEMLHEDAQLRELLESGQSIDGQSALELLK